LFDPVSVFTPRFAHKSVHNPAERVHAPASLEAAAGSRVECPRHRKYLAGDAVAIHEVGRSLGGPLCRHALASGEAEPAVEQTLDCPAQVVGVDIDAITGHRGRLLVRKWG
jgi:hypothetical protein